ncbi:hypothetical protein M3599_15335 [Niallia circulans]|uniref:hypothetical protein n=1 Tax=Niallia circulans TaxID=1397 RepID=UPI002040E919|nr:hypothetical protein [Niallia circulans]MCM2982298.1 hypothetical protein [Niallia circulans]
MTNLVKKAEYKQPLKAESKLEGLRKRKSDKVNYILQIEKLWEKYAFNRNEENLNKLVRSLKLTINRKADAMESKWRITGLCKADFESVYYEELWKLCDNYNHYGEFYFYETFLLVIRNRSIDVTRKLTTKKGTFQKNILPLKEEVAKAMKDLRTDIEKEVINRDLVHGIFSDKSLSTQELKLLQAIYSNPNSSYRELATELGLNSHKEVTRMLSKIKKKLLYIFL